MCLFCRNESLENIEVLNCSGCTQIESLPKLPERLLVIDCNDCINLKTLPKLPENLCELNCSGCIKLQSLPELPQDLLGINCNGCVLLKTLPKLPNDLFFLNCENCVQLEILHNLPINMMFRSSGCTRLYLRPRIHIIYRPNEVNYYSQSQIYDIITRLQKRFIEKIYHPDSKFVRNKLDILQKSLIILKPDLKNLTYPFATTFTKGMQ